MKFFKSRDVLNTALAALFGMTLHAQSAQKRVALVIGVKNYQYVSPLNNTLNDARDMSDALKAKGFRVIESYDPQTKRQLQDVIIKYFQLLESDKNSSGVLFYSGHGMQVDGSNYLIPAQANPQIKADLDDQCLNMDYVMRAIEQAGNHLNIFILDACRNNPFKGFYRSGEQGLNMVATPKGSYIVYATKPGSVASDGTGKNGLFTSKLLKHMIVEGLNIEQVFKQVAADVSTESNDAQRPWIASDYTGDFFFTPGTNRPYDVEPPTPKAYLVEDFSQNSRGWLESETEEYSFKFVDGKYRIKSKKGGSWFCTLPLSFNTNNDFEISMTLTKVDGTDGYYFGAVLGLNTLNGYFHFMGLTGWGNYVLFNKGPAAKDLITSTPNDVVQTGNAPNQIMLKKVSNTFKLYVNGKLMGETPHEEFFGDYFGFRIWSGEESLTVDVDNFIIKAIN